MGYVRDSGIRRIDFINECYCKCVCYSIIIAMATITYLECRFIVEIRQSGVREHVGRALIIPRLVNDTSIREFAESGFVMLIDQL